MAAWLDEDAGTGLSSPPGRSTWVRTDRAAHRENAAMRITIEEHAIDPTALVEVLMPDGVTYTLEGEGNLDPMLTDLQALIGRYRSEMMERSPLSKNGTEVEARTKNAIAAEFEEPMLYGIAMLAVYRELHEV